MVRPWRRFWARFFDYLIVFTLICLILNLAAPGWRESFLLQGLWVSFLAILIWVPVEALLLEHFGTTPGKALLCIHVDWHAHRSFHKTFMRARTVWWYGMGAGIPILNLVFMGISCGQLLSTQTTKWDHESHSLVHFKLLTPIRVFVYIFFAIVMDFIGFELILEFMMTFVFMKRVFIPFQ